MSFSIFPRTVYQVKSKISGPIEVKEQLEQYTLHVQGLIQSGGMIRGLWRKALGRISYEVYSIERILILGLGGGTVVHLIKSRWPKAEIVGIEIDPAIIRIGKKFFSLGKVKDLKIINADAFEWMKLRTPPRWPDGLLGGGKSNKRFELIIVDLYLGKEFPKQVESREFLEGIKKLLAKNGLAIFNRLRVNREDLRAFEDKLKKRFSEVKRIKTATNLLFIART